LFDKQLRRLLDPTLNRIANAIVRSDLGANSITLFGAIIGLCAGAAIALGAPWTALVLIALSRTLDGLDGAVARIKGPTAWGGYLDSLCDYLFYLAVPLGFAVADPANLLPALLLVASFTLTSVSFLALAAILAGREMGHGEKAFSYTSGLMEGGETITFFVVFCLFPAWFGGLAMVFAGLCVLTAAQRLLQARALLR
jgi:phosphatidylglycerophosphate synthase